MTEAVDQATEIINSRGVMSVDLAIVLGEGLGGVVDGLENPIVIPYADLPGFPDGLSDPDGCLVVADQEGVKVAYMRGRAEFHRNADAAAMAAPIETLAMLGAQNLVVTGGVGSVRAEPASPPEKRGSELFRRGVTALQNGAVTFNATATLDCPMVAELDQWLADTVQPAAQARFGMNVVQINSMGSYACRGMNNQRGASLSEHSFGNALDIGGFVLANGRQITLVRDWWHGDDQARAFLMDVHRGSCGHFTTVLSPGSNAFHYNHIHVDLAMHGRSGRSICRPEPQDTLPPPDPSPLIAQRRVAIIGPIRQEILSGIRSIQVFETLRNRLAAFPDLPLDTALFEEAAGCFNRCRARGFAGTPIDMLLCAVADRFGLSIFTTDRDFERYAEVLSTRLHARPLCFPARS